VSSSLISRSRLTDLNITFLGKPSMIAAVA
jgi:hypothetical protein